MGAEIILRRVELRLAHEHRAAHGTVSTRPTLLVEFRQMHDGTAVSGWGECPALPDPGYFHEYTDGAQAMLTNLLIPAVVAGGSLSPDAVDAATAIAPGHPMARSALALAAEDLTARVERSTLSQRWGAVRDRLPPGTSVSTTTGTGPNSDAGLAELGKRASVLAAAGYRRLKVKVSPSHDVAPLQAVIDSLRATGHANVQVAADANGSYRPTQPAHADALRRLDALGLAWIEQPFPAELLVDLARLAQRLDTPICLDESVTSLGQLRAARALGMRPVVCVKQARLGGPRAAREVLGWCHSHNFDAYVGGMLSSGIGRAADRALAALPGATLIGDIGADVEYFGADVTAPFAVSDDTVPVISDPAVHGLGVTVSASAVARLTSESWRWTIENGAPPAESRRQ